jgi:hypothetical protein
MVDEFDNDFLSSATSIKEIFVTGNYVEVFGFVQWVLRHRDRPYEFDRQIDRALTRARSAYRLLDGDTIIPIGSNEEHQNIVNALADVASSEFRGARTHLKNAAIELSAGNWPASVRESIHAVESVARVLDPKSNTLAPALARLEKSISLHQALKIGFSRLYATTRATRRAFGIPSSARRLRVSMKLMPYTCLDRVLPLCPTS